jgi:hypothetical protein
MTGKRDQRGKGNEIPISTSNVSGEGKISFSLTRGNGDLFKG